MNIHVHLWLQEMLLKEHFNRFQPCLHVIGPRYNKTRTPGSARPAVTSQKHHIKLRKGRQTKMFVGLAIILYMMMSLLSTHWWAVEPAYQ